LDVALLSADVLVVNAGSTSLKLSVVDGNDQSQGVASWTEVPRVSAVGHRVVHGGERFAAPTVIDDEVVAALESIVELAPLHNAPALAAIENARTALPSAAHVAVFDTAFHHSIPAVARTYALPPRFRDLGIRRYGFHGLSVSWAAERVPTARLVVCHLGGGASVTGVLEGKSIDTTMGFTPLEGVPMATRAGSIDPGAILYLLRHGASVAELDHALEHESGLLGLAGSGDVAVLEAATSAQATLALDVYCYRIAQAVGAMATALGGLDALVFTAGVGEHSARVRAEVCRRLLHLGVTIDDEVNAAIVEEGAIATAGAAVEVHVVHAREDVVVARAVRMLLRLDD
jgi:acetate kinase